MECWFHSLPLLACLLKPFSFPFCTPSVRYTPSVGIIFFDKLYFRTKKKYNHTGIMLFRGRKYAVMDSTMVGNLFEMSLYFPSSCFIINFNVERNLLRDTKHYSTLAERFKANSNITISTVHFRIFHLFDSIEKLRLQAFQLVLLKWRPVNHMLNVCLVARFWQSHSAHSFDVHGWIWFYAYLCISWWNSDLWNLLLTNYANYEWSVMPWVITMVKDNVKMIRSELDSMNLNRCIRTILWQFGFSNESFQF